MPMMAHSALPNLLVLNSEPVPVNLFPRNTTLGDLGSVQWVFDIQAAGWSVSPLLVLLSLNFAKARHTQKWLGTSAASEVRHISGSYSVVAPGTSLRYA